MFAGNAQHASREGYELNIRITGLSLGLRAQPSPFDAHYSLKVEGFVPLSYQVSFVS